MGFAEKAVEVFSTVKDFDCKPDVFTYNSVLHVMVQKQVLLLALAVYNKMLKLNCHSNVTTYSILIEGLCKNGDPISEMTRTGILPNEITYTIILAGLCQGRGSTRHLNC